MPADRISNTLQYDFGNSHFFHDPYLSLSHQYIFEQTRVPNKNGIADFKPAPEAYSLFTMYASSILHVKHLPIKLSLGVQNIFNTVYRDYLNGFRYFTDEMGRNIYLQLNIPFAKKYSL